MGLSFITISATTLRIRWYSPEVTNGEIQLYSVLVEVCTSFWFQGFLLKEQATFIIFGEIDSVNTYKYNYYCLFKKS